MPTLTVVFAGEGMHGCMGSRHYLASMPLPHTHVLLLSSRYLLLAGKGSTAARMCTNCGSATCLKLVLRPFTTQQMLLLLLWQTLHVNTCNCIADFVSWHSCCYIQVCTQQHQHHDGCLQPLPTLQVLQTAPKLICYSALHGVFRSSLPVHVITHGTVTPIGLHMLWLYLHGAMTYTRTEGQ